ncbi:hypothetical protein [Nocardia harenae]|uniref:hypothetical protein n=1 Tax=Nocardia harenae TaxID=358707 RepID=UPI00082BDCFA|nr:hypothetical protein [Nocardia harenae]
MGQKMSSRRAGDRDRAPHRLLVLLVVMVAVVVLVVRGIAPETAVAVVAAAGLAGAETAARLLPGGVRGEQR